MTKLTADHICGKRISLKFINKHLCDSELGALVLLNEISNIHLTHESFELGLEVSDNTLTAKVLSVDDNFRGLNYEDKFVILNVHQAPYLPYIYYQNLVVGWKGQEESYAFKSQKQLLKFKRRFTQ